MQSIDRSARHPWALLLMFGLGACASGEAEANHDGPAVILSSEDVAEVGVATLRAGVTVTGTLDPYRRVDVRTQIEGTITQISAERGDQVRIGQPLVRIAAQGIQSRAISTEAAVAAAAAGVAQAERELESGRALVAAGAMSDMDFRAIQTGYESARAQLASADAQNASASEEASRMIVRAPIDGEVSVRSANEGEAVRSDATLFTVVNTSILELSGQVPVVEAIRVREGQTVECTLEGYPGQRFEGVVSHVAPVADRATRQVGVTMRLGNPDRTLIAGLFATGRIITETEDSALVVPVSAIRNDGSQPFVWLLAESTLVKRPVELGTRSDNDGLVAVRKGLVAGDRVVVSPGEVSEGSAFRLVSADSWTDKQVPVAMGGGA